MDNSSYNVVIGNKGLELYSKAQNECLHLQLWVFLNKFYYIYIDTHNCGF